MQEKRITVASLNIAHGRGARGHQLFWPRGIVERNLASIAEFLSEVKSDIAALQEVDTCSFWNGGFNHAAFIGREAGIEHFFTGDHMSRMRLLYGTSLLSRFELENSVTVSLPTTAMLPPKGYVFSEIDFHGSRVGIVSLHLDFARKKSRMRQVEILISNLKHWSGPLIVMGDFNSEWETLHSAVRRVAETLDLATHEDRGKELVTFPGSRRCWDWILFSKHFSLVDYEVHNTVLSDHRPVVAQMEILEAV